MTGVDMFTIQQASRLLGLSRSQLLAWDRGGLYRPRWAGDDQRADRLYSFRDLVGLRLLAVLRDEHGLARVDLQRVGAWLAEHGDTPWTALRVDVSGRHVDFGDEQARTHANGQVRTPNVVRYELESLADDVR